MNTLFFNYNRLLRETDTRFIRYLYPDIEWDSRFIAIVGSRGVGKTTLLLQHIILTHAERESLYVTANDPYFAEHTLYETAEDFYNNGGKYLYIDEIHKYRNWSNEVKMMYDSFKKLQVVLSGSNMLAIRKEIDADNSRRVVSYILEGLSFREFLNFKMGLKIHPCSLADIIAGNAILPKKSIEHPLPLYREYLETGYFPFFKEGLYYQRLNGIIAGTMEEDIAQYTDLTAGQIHKLRHLLSAVATSVPYKPNYSDLARHIEVDRRTIPSYLLYMEKSGLIKMLAAPGDGNSYIEKAEKIYLGNPNFINALSMKSANVGNLRETAFMCSMSVGHDVRASGKSDFVVDGITFEIGGPNKKSGQIKGIDNAYVVRDDIESAAGNVLPLWSFGLNY